MLKTEEIIILDLVVAAEQSKAMPDDDAATELLQKRIHTSRQITNGKLDLEVFEKFFAIRFPESPLTDYAAGVWLDRFVDGWEWQQGDYQTRRALQEAAPKVYPTDLNAFFNRLTCIAVCYKCETLNHPDNMNCDGETALCPTCAIEEGREKHAPEVKKV